MTPRRFIALVFVTGWAAALTSAYSTGCEVQDELAAPVGLEVDVAITPH